MTKTKIPKIFAFWIRKPLLIFALINILLITFPFATMVDYLTNETLYSPNPRCESIPGIAAVIAVIIFMPVMNILYLCTKGKTARGAEPLCFMPPGYIRYLIALGILALLTGIWIADFIGKLSVISPIELTENCSGGAETVTVTVGWRPSIIYELWLTGWLFCSCLISMALVTERVKAEENAPHKPVNQTH